MQCTDIYSLCIPGTNVYLYPGSRVQLGRFDEDVWMVQYGWYSWGGNRPVCGWYLTRIGSPYDLKPLQLTDLDDIYLVET